MDQPGSLSICVAGIVFGMDGSAIQSLMPVTLHYNQNTRCQMLALYIDIYLPFRW